MRLMHTMVLKYGYLHVIELQEKAGRISITKYNQLKSYFAKIYEDTVGYDKPRKIWYALNPVDEIQRREMISMELITE